jgi:tRNA U34 5-methylaminomethyl-2-thiouridine-forming methyltransferase MnmC
MFASGTQKAELTWRAGDVPVSTRFEDPYFAFADGLAEARHVYLAGNGLPERFRPGFQIAELGFGTGLNALAALQAWRSASHAGPLRYTSFEAFPMDVAAMERALGVWPELAPLAAPLVRAWAKGARLIELPGLQLTIVEGDAREMLAHWAGRADAWFLDGFSPARNPELWEPRLMAEVAGHTAPGGTFATYSAAGAVRRTLAEVGFEVIRSPGFGSKRHMSRGNSRVPDDRRAMIP